MPAAGAGVDIVVKGTTVRIDDSSPHSRYGDVAEATHAAVELWLRSWRPTVPLPHSGGNAADAYNRDATGLAMQAGLVLSYKKISLTDVYVASAALMLPSLVRLADRRDEAAHRRLREVLAVEQVRPTGLAGVLRRELAFQSAVVDALGLQTLIVLKDMLHEIIECAASRLDGRSAPSVRYLAEARTHHDIVRLVEAGRGRAAATLARERTREIDGLIRENVADNRLSRLILGSW
jgi:DNA-binding FadR family transcriptional regulator